MRILRITRTPALESAIARFDTWWSSRSARERVMLTVLALILAALILVFGIIGPLQNARARALADIRTYETINARLRAGGTIQASAQPMRTGSLPSVISESAASFGLSPRLDQAPGGYRAILTDVPYDSLVSWLGDIGATSKLSIRTVSIQRGGGAGRVNATIGFGA